MIKLPSGIDLKSLIEDLRILSWEACETLLHYSQILKDSKNKINILKNDNQEDPVTLADLKVNEIIINNFNEKYKNINWEILSEENVKLEPNSFNTNCDWLWILDPLDGTKDFIQGTSNYAMHLALNYKQKPCLGIVLIPEKDELWISYGKDVWCEKRDGSKIYPNLSQTNDLHDMVLVTSKNHRNQNLTDLVQKVGFKDVKCMGSIGCKISSIIRGETDLYVSLSLPGQSSPKDWDFAAPESILRASGGAITNLENEDLKYNQENFEHRGIIIASNDYENHKNICMQLKELILKYEIYPLNS